jgi:hypothetical protein
MLCRWSYNADRITNWPRRNNLCLYEPIFGDIGLWGLYCDKRCASAPTDPRDCRNRGIGENPPKRRFCQGNGRSRERVGPRAQQLIQSLVATIGAVPEAVFSIFGRVSKTVKRGGTPWSSMSGSGCRCWIEGCIPATDFLPRGATDDVEAAKSR